MLAFAAQWAFAFLVMFVLPGYGLLRIFKFHEGRDAVETFCYSFGLSSIFSMFYFYILSLPGSAGMNVATLAAPALLLFAAGTSKAKLKFRVPSGRERVLLAALVFLFLFALGLRTLETEKYPEQLLDGDPYRHMVITNEMVKTGHSPVFEPLTVGQFPVLYPRGFYVLESAFAMLSGAGVFGVTQYLAPFLASMTAFTFFVLARALLGSVAASFIATILLLMTPTHVVGTQWPSSEALGAVFVPLAFAFYLDAVRGHRRMFVAAALMFAALVFIDTFKAFFFGPVLLLFPLLGKREDMKRNVGYAVLSLIGVALLLPALSYPLDRVSPLAKLGGHLYEIRDYSAYGATPQTFADDMGIVVFLFALPGIAVCALKRKPLHLFLLLSAALIAPWIALHLARIPLVPWLFRYDFHLSFFFALFGGVFVAAFERRLKRRRIPVFALVSLLLVFYGAFTPYPGRPPAYGLEYNDLAAWLSNSTAADAVVVTDWWTGEAVRSMAERRVVWFDGFGRKYYDYMVAGGIPLKSNYVSGAEEMKKLDRTGGVYVAVNKVYHGDMLRYYANNPDFSARLNTSLATVFKLL